MKNKSFKIGYWKGKKFSDSHKNKMSITRTGKKMPIGTGEKIAIAKLGKSRSEETKEKIKLTMKKIWNTAEKREFARQRRLKQKNIFKDTGIEIAVQNELTKRNILFEKHTPVLKYIPDIFIEPNICIFCDGNYWHGNPDKYKSVDIIRDGKRAKSAQEIWAKDWGVTKTLTEANYFVLRFWESEIEKDINLIGNKIENLLR